MVIQMNEIILEGKVTSEVICDYDSFDRKIYKFQISIKRKSGTRDTLNCVMDERPDCKKDDYVRVSGAIRSKYEISGSAGHCRIFVYGEKCEKLKSQSNLDTVWISGEISKMCVLRMTPMSNKYILDFVVKVTDGSGSHYIPTIAWGVTALMLSGMQKGDEILFSGRFQSRAYSKRLEDGTEEMRTAYEVSCNRIGEVKN